MKRVFFAVLASACCTPLAAPAQPATFSAGLVIVNGTHTERGGTASAHAIPAPVLAASQRYGRFEFRAEGIPPIGRVPVSGGALGMDGIGLTYLDATARYYPTPYTSLGIGETIYNQETTYARTYSTLPGVGGSYVIGNNETDRSRVVGMQFEVVQTLRRTLRSNLALRIAVNPRLTGKLGESERYRWSDGSQTVGRWFVTPENGSQFDTALTSTVADRRYAFDYGVRYLSLTMRFPDGTLADRNTFLVPFAGLTMPIGR